MSKGIVRAALLTLLYERLRVRLELLLDRTSLLVALLSPLPFVSAPLLLLLPQRAF
jgi:hypothetical protein